MIAKNISARNEYHTDRLRKAALIVWLGLCDPQLSPFDAEPAPKWLEHEVARLQIALDLGPGAQPTPIDKLRWRALGVVNAIRINASASKDPVDRESIPAVE